MVKLMINLNLLLFTFYIIIPSLRCLFCQISPTPSLLKRGTGLDENSSVSTELNIILGDLQSLKYGKE